MILNSQGILALTRELRRIDMTPEASFKCAQQIVEHHLRGQMLRFHLGMPIVEVAWNAGLDLLGNPHAANPSPPLIAASSSKATTSAV